MELTVTLGRALVAGETIDVPLSIGGTNVTTADWSLAAKAGMNLNTGVTLSGQTTATPNVRFAGAGAETATLVLTAAADGVTESGGESYTIALGPDGTGANGFDRTTLGTNVGGGADPHGTANTFSVQVDEPPATTTPEVSITAGTSPVTEGTIATFTVTASSAPSANLTVNLTVTDAPNADFVASTSEGSGKSVGIAAGMTTATYGVATVGGAGETTDEPKGPVTVTVAAGTGYTVSSSAGSAMVTVEDNDATTVTLARTGSGAIAENGGTATITVTLGRRLYAGETLTAPLDVSGTGIAAGDYTLALSTGGNLNEGVTLSTGNPYSAAEPAVAFAGHNTNAVQTATLTLTATDDSTDEGDLRDLGHRPRRPDRPRPRRRRRHHQRHGVGGDYRRRRPAALARRRQHHPGRGDAYFKQRQRHLVP